MEKLLLTSVLALGLVGGTANAGVASNQTVVSVGCYDEAPDNVACFMLLPAAVGPAACNEAQLRWDGTTTTGKNLTAVGMTAYALGQKVRVSFDDVACFSGDTKDFPLVKWIRFE